MFTTLGGEPLTGVKSEFGESRGPTFLDELQCENENERLLDCPSLYFLSSCTNQDIGVRCYGNHTWPLSLCILTKNWLTNQPSVYMHRCFLYMYAKDA